MFKTDSFLFTQMAEMIKFVFQRRLQVSHAASPELHSDSWAGATEPQSPSESLKGFKSLENQDATWSIRKVLHSPVFSNWKNYIQCLKWLLFDPVVYEAFIRRPGHYVSTEAPGSVTVTCCCDIKPHYRVLALLSVYFWGRSRRHGFWFVSFDM